jgi:two-component system cell cycle sensor histidine kinase/response regulator CckA
VTVRARDGRRVPVLVSSRLITLRAERLVLSYIRDITDWRRAQDAVHESEARLRAYERRLEEQLQQAQRLESVGRLAGGVAHDFNNLLTVILSCAESLKARAAAWPAAPEDLVEEVDEIRSAGRRAAELTRKLLAFARKQVISPVALDVCAVLRNDARMLRRLLGEDVELRIDAERGPCPVRCDESQLEQLVVNLALNARDAMPRGGRLTIEAANVDLTDDDASAYPGAQAGPYVRLAVTDSGVGMSAEVKARAFEPFFTTKPVGKGTGLGLATVYGIVKQSGGSIRLESEPDRGTRFEILLPRIESAALEDAADGEAVRAERMCSSS